MFMRQVARTLTAADDEESLRHRVLICDRDRKWSASVRQFLADAEVRVVQTPFQAPNANAHAERFVRSIKSECLDRVILLGERHLRQTIREFMEHYNDVSYCSPGYVAEVGEKPKVPCSTLGIVPSRPRCRTRATNAATAGASKSRRLNT